MAQTSFLPEAILVTTAGVIGATAAGQCVNLTAAQLRSFASVYSQAEVAAAFQPLDSTLTALAGVTTAADKVIYATGADTFSTTTLSSFGRSLIDDADAATARSTLGLGTMATQASTSYLALSGGTMTGALSGTSATYSGTVKGAKLAVGAADLGCPLDLQGQSSTAYSAAGLGNHPASAVIYNLDSTAGSYAQIAIYNRAAGVGYVRLVGVSRGNSDTDCMINVQGVDRLVFDSSADTASFSGMVSLGAFTFATLPSASANAGKCLRITDRGQKLAYCDGTNWLFVHDNSVVV